jgi:hypothetical protein
VPGTLEQPFPHQVVKTWIKTTGGNPESVCGNRVVAYPGSAAEKPCPSQDPKLVNVMPATRK